MEKFKITISQKLREQALEILTARGNLEEAIEIPSEGDEVRAVLSPNPGDLIALQEIEHDGKTYYLGIPRS